MDPKDPNPDAGSNGTVGEGGTVEDGCGANGSVKCAQGQPCKEDADCNGACSYAGTCVDAPSCKYHLGGDTCGKGEVGTDLAQHENCCRTLPVKGFTDGAHPGKEVYLDKYEITAGRVRAFLDAMNARYGKVDMQRWVNENAPPQWNPNWTPFLPADRDAGALLVKKENLGDPRPAPDSMQPVPTSDQNKHTGSDYQFNAELLLYLHGNNCGTQQQSYGFPTFFYPGDVLAKLNVGTTTFPPRADGKDDNGVLIPASEHLDVKSMNCITNAMLVAFCAWDGGQLATEEVLDYVTGTPASLGDKAGCGTQSNGTDPPETDAQMKGGRCADLDKINATFDAGGQLPRPDHPANTYNYMFPFLGDAVSHDKSWVIAAPGRGTWATNKEPADMVRIDPADEPWMDLHGNVMEAALKTTNGQSTGQFAMKYRGIGYQSARSHLNIDVEWGVDGIKRIARAEAKAAFTGGRCMRFK
ncbi:MAG: hypothetical protein KIT84_29920 [Labilithrix sp.]|nr:hypothetical protein [Labilithrix sp.]MCW5815282.1 hypothetical protein [Labilithrix sp.]